MAKYFCLALHRKPVIYFKLIDQAHCNIGHHYNDLAIPERTIPYGIVLYGIISYHTISYRITSHNIPYRVIPHHIIPYMIYRIIYCTIWHHILYHIYRIIYHIILHHTPHHTTQCHITRYHMSCRLLCGKPYIIPYHITSYHIIISYHISYHIAGSATNHGISNTLCWKKTQPTTKPAIS